jgi:hypothetical protein
MKQQQFYTKMQPEYPQFIFVLILFQVSFLLYYFKIFKFKMFSAGWMLGFHHCNIV